MINANLVAYLKSFYSNGQLELFYCTLTDGKAIPGMNERERSMRLEAIRHILGKPDLTIPAPKTKSKKKK